VKKTLQLVNKHLNPDMDRLLEEAELDEAQEQRLKCEFACESHLITRDDRLEAVAKDVVAHFVGRGFQCKAVMISIDKAVVVHWRICMADDAIAARMR
jgi:type I restriction enzyme R subunit